MRLSDDARTHLFAALGGYAVALIAVTTLSSWRNRRAKKTPSSQTTQETDQ